MTNITPTTPPPEGTIDTQVIGHVLLIGINRPAKRNGWTPPMFRQLAEAYTRLDDDPQLRVGVLHAFGDHFTAGLDLPAVSAYMQRGEKAIPEGLVEPHDYGLPGYRRRTKPMVVAVKGICFTVGIELMLGADIVVAADNCRFSQMEVQRGIMATGGATLRMAERAGTGNARHACANDGEVALRFAGGGGGGGGRCGGRRGRCAGASEPFGGERIRFAHGRPFGDVRQKKCDAKPTATTLHAVPACAHLIRVTNDGGFPAERGVWRGFAAGSATTAARGRGR